MLCEKCRIREANVRFMEIINGVKNEHNLCAQCAAEMNFGPYTTLLEGEFSQMLEQGEKKSDVVCDYIAGMTDNYAIEVFEEIYIPRAWSIH